MRPEDDEELLGRVVVVELGRVLDALALDGLDELLTVGRVVVDGLVAVEGLAVVVGRVALAVGLLVLPELTLAPEPLPPVVLGAR